MILGTGILNWPSSERVSDRYGAVSLFDAHQPPAKAAKMRDAMDADVAAAAAGAFGRLYAIVIEPRQFSHVGDWFRGLFPVTPERGERIVFGTGTAFTENLDGDLIFGLKPADDRYSDWLDPTALYRAHEQVVELHFEPVDGVAA